MCEFCTENGKGKTRYLQMRNYSDMLLHEELSSDQREVAQVMTRVEWLDRFLDESVLPAMGRVAVAEDEEDDSLPPSDNRAKATRTDEEILAHRKAIHFGQVLPIEDVEAVIDIASSITRMPCG